MEMYFGKFKLRDWTFSDASSLAKYANNRKIWLNMRDGFPYPYTEKDGLSWIHIAMARSGIAFAIADEVEAIGAIDFRRQTDVYRKSAEVGYWLAEPFWGQGIATQALSLLVSYIQASYDLVRLYACVFDWNPASARVLEKAGFKLEGRLAKAVFKNGVLVDELLYARIMPS
jgi:[ribosomal protein S5]-alanine N-acetyltransferase